MKYYVYWTNFATKKLDEIYYYYSEIAGEHLASDIINKLIDKTISLEFMPKIGMVEKLLENRPQEFRYLVYNNYKIIYYINDSLKRVIVVNVFDVRQNPVKLIEY